MRTHRVTPLLFTMIALACADDSPIDGDDEVGSETETDTGDDGLAPTQCAAPCAIAMVRAEDRPYYELWAIELADPEQPGEPQFLVDGGLFNLSVPGPTPWATLGVFTDVLGTTLTLQLDVDGQGEIVAEPLLPFDVDADLHDWQFSDDGQVAVMRGGVEAFFSGNRLWGARFVDGAAVTFEALDPPHLDSEHIVASALSEDGSAVAFLRGHDYLSSQLHVTTLLPEFGQPIQLSTDTDDVTTFVWSGDHVVAIVHPNDAYDYRVEVWSLDDPMAAPITFAEDVEPSLASGGDLVSWLADTGSLVVADVAAGEFAPVPIADVSGHVWLREEVLLASAGDARSLVMVEFGGVVAGVPMLVDDLLEDGAEVGRPSCDAEGHWCGYTVTAGAERRVEFVDVSGSGPMPPQVALEGLAADDAVEIAFAGTTHATISVGPNLYGHEALHVVELGDSPVSATAIVPPNSMGQRIELAERVPADDRLLFVTRDPETDDEFLWRARADGSGVQQVTFAPGWVFEYVDVLE